MLAAVAIAMFGTHLRAAPDPNPTISVVRNGHAVLQTRHSFIE